MLFGCLLLHCSSNLLCMLDNQMKKSFQLKVNKFQQGIKLVLHQSLGNMILLGMLCIVWLHLESKNLKNRTNKLSLIMLRLLMSRCLLNIELVTHHY